MRFVLDTNHLGEATRTASLLTVRVAEEHRQGHRFGVIVPILCETQAGLAQTHDPDGARERLDEILEIVRVWPLEVVNALAFGKLHRDLRARGRVLAAVDIMIAAVTLRMRATLLTTDRDFEALPEVPTENWLAEPMDEARRKSSGRSRSLNRGGAVATPDGAAFGFVAVWRAADQGLAH